MSFFSFFSRKPQTEAELQEAQETLDNGLQKSKESVLSKIGRAIAGKTTVDDDVLDELEEALITSDVGVETTLHIIERVQARAARDKYLGTAELNTILVEETAALLKDAESVDSLPLDGERVPEAGKGLPYGRKN